MTIEKNGKFYAVRENKKSWTVIVNEGRVSISANIPKDICPNFDDLKAYVTENDLF